MNLYKSAICTQTGNRKTEEIGPETEPLPSPRKDAPSARRNHLQGGRTDGRDGKEVLAEKMYPAIPGDTIIIKKEET